MARSSLIPGFRFHPTDVELVMYYLKRKLLGKKIIVNVVAEVNIYDFGPWDLPEKSSLRNGDLEWYFFCPKSKKYASGTRSNRATENGFWKATGKDRKVTYKGRTVATIKTLVYHLRHTGTGQRTDWVMHEYKMEDEQLANAGVVQDMYVLCKIFEKSGSGPRNGDQYGAPFYEEAWDDDLATCYGSQAISDPNTVGPSTMNMTVSHSTGSLCITEPDSSAVTYSRNEHTTNTLNNCNNKMKASMNVSLGEPGSSAVTCFPVENTANTLNNYNKLKATVMTISANEPGSSSLTISPNEMYANVPPLDHDVMLFEDLVSFLGLSPDDLLNGNNQNEGPEFAMAPKEDECIYDELGNFINLDNLNGENFKTDGATAEHTPDKMIAADDLDAVLSKFWAD